jgi:gliding motility-associated-like protein
LITTGSIVLSGLPSGNWTLNPGAITGNSSTTTINGLTSGVYNFTVTNAVGCTSAATANVVINLLPTAPTITSTQTNVLCYGAANGAIDITVAGGTVPYTYSWTGSGVVSSSEDQTGLTAGLYSVIVTDANSCPSVSLSVTLTEPSKLSGKITSQTNVTIFGGNDGNITLTGTGGTSPYQYKLGSGAYQSSGTFGALTAGSYSLSILDVNLCPFDTVVTITQPATLITGSITAKTNITCFGTSTGSVTVAGSGGVAPYEYTIDAGSYQSSGTFNNLIAGTHIVTVIDASHSSHDVTVLITQPSSAVEASNVSQTNVLCMGSSTGSVTVAGSGGISPYKYSIGNNLFQDSGTFGDLSAGSYSITVQDANLCPVAIPVTITQPEKLAITFTKQESSCPIVKDGSIALTITGGVQPYSVIWSDGNTTLNRSNIVSGTYSVVVTDQNGCAASIDIVLGFTGSEKCIEVQEIITPNNDGYYDTWKIKNIDRFPNAEVEVFTRWGKRVFVSKNISANEWDGTYKGKLLPTDSYHYILYLHDGSEPITGTVTIIR